MPVAKPQFFDPATPVAPSHGGVEFYGNLSARLQQFQQNTSNLALKGIQKERSDALTAYSAEALLELSEQIPALEARSRDESQEDGLTPIERFDAGADGLRRGMLQDAPASIREDLALYIDERLIGARSKLAGAVAAEDRARAKTSLLRGLNTMADNVAAAYANGDDNLAELEAQSWENLFRNGVSSGLLNDPAENSKLAETALSRFRTATIIGGFEAAYDESDGAAIEYMTRFAEKVPSGMSPEEHEQVWKDMEARYSRHTKHDDDDRKRIQRERTERHQEGERQAALAMLRGDQVDVEMLLDLDLVSDTFALKHEERAAARGPAFDDAPTKAFYELNLLDYSEEEIMEDGDLTFDTRADLVEARREMVEDQENWRNSQAGREAARRVKTSVGLPDGIMVQGMSSALKRKANDALSAFYDEVEAELPEDRAGKAIEIADRIVRKVEAADAAADLGGARDKLADAEDEMSQHDEGTAQYKTAMRNRDRWQRKIDELERKAGNVR